jgi:hypothetical protein
MKLFPDLAVELRHIAHVDRVVATGRAFRKEPIGKPAIPNLAVRPGADAGYNIHPVLSAKLDETSQVALARPIEMTFNFLVMDPDHVGADDLNPGGFHLENLILPITFRITAVMKLPHHRKPGFSIHREIGAV